MKQSKVRKLLPIGSYESFKKINKTLWKYCWKYWYQKEYIHQGIKEYLAGEISEIKKSKPEIRLLDIGCGTAWCAKYFDHLYSSYTGIDFNEELIEQLFTDYANHEKCVFYSHDIESKNILPFQGKKFNVVLANFILLELAEPETFFEMSASLQETGDYLIITGLDAMNEIFRISDSPKELEENLNIYRHAETPVVLQKQMSFNGDSTNFMYLRVLYSIKDIMSLALSHGYQVDSLDDKFNQYSDSIKSPLYYTLKLKKS